MLTKDATGSMVFETAFVQIQPSDTVTFFRVTQAFLPRLKSSGHANIVKVSSGLGSLGWLSDPDDMFFGVNYLGYNSSKTALNAVTLALAKDLTGTGIKVNAADPGYTATNLNGHTGYRTVEQAAAGIVWLATPMASGQQAVSILSRTKCFGKIVANRIVVA